MKRRRLEKELSKRLEENVHRIEEVLGENPDVVIRRLLLGAYRRVSVTVISMEGLSDLDFVSEYVIAPIQTCDAQVSLTRTNALAHLSEALNAGARVGEARTCAAVVESVLAGKTALLIDGSDVALIVNTTKLPSRPIQEPEAETVVHGPREGFTESLGTTMALIRNRVRNAGLRFESLSIGRESPTPVSIVYIEGVVDEDVLAKVRERIKRVDVDVVLDTAFIEEFICDQPYTIYPTVLSTERPDKVTAALLEGRVAIAAQGTPFVLVMPATLWDFLTSPEDYYEHPVMMTFVRWVRVLAYVIALTLPSLYVALTSFHQEMIPTTLALRIAAGREGTAFPAVVEALLLEMQFELLREAGLRIPRKVGTAVSIVGVLVIGQALVAAGVVSPILITVVGATAIASFAVPLFSISAPTRLLKFPLMILAGTFGFYGIVFGVTLILTHLVTLNSFGRPYMTPLAPLRPRGLYDSPLLRAPWWLLVRRRREGAKGRVHDQE